MYCIVSKNGEEVNTENAANISIDFKDYENVFFDKKLRTHKMKKIQSRLHKIGTYDVCKRYILNDRITTLAYFHKDLKD